MARGRSGTSKLDTTALYTRVATARSRQVTSPLDWLAPLPRKDARAAA